VVVVIGPGVTLVVVGTDEILRSKTPIDFLIKWMEDRRLILIDYVT
jgi:hypothetical protein